MSDMLDELVLKTGKKVVLRPGKIADEESAAARIPDEKSKNKFSYGLALQMEIIRMRIVSVDGKRPSAVQLEDLDKLFTSREFAQVIKFIEHEGKEGNDLMPQVNQVASSGKE